MNSGLWSVKRLDEIAEVRAGSPAPQGAEFFDPTGVPFVRVQDVGRHWRTMCLRDTKDRINQHAIDTFRPAFAKAGTIVFPKSGAAINTNSRAILGIDAYIVSHLAMVTAKDGVVLPEWLYFWLCSLDLTSLSRTTSLPSIRLSDLKNLDVPVVPLPEQRRIVTRIKEMMSRVEEIQKLREEALKEAAIVLSALLHHIEKDQAWPLCRVGDILKETKNGRSIRSNNKQGNGYVLTITAVRDVNLDCSSRKPVELDNNLIRTYAVKINDVFISRSNTIELVGLSAIASETPPPRTIYPDLLIRLTPDLSRVVPRYLAFALRFPSVRDQIRMFAKGTSQSMVKISGTSLKEILIPLPTIEEQRQLIVRFDQFHKVNFELKSELSGSDFSNVPKSILHKAFAGEL